RQRRARQGELIVEAREAELGVLPGVRQQPAGGLYRGIQLGSGSSVGGQLAVEDRVLLTHDGGKREELVRGGRRWAGLLEARGLLIETVEGDAGLLRLGQHRVPAVKLAIQRIPALVDLLLVDRAQVAI